ncbi:MAG: hypothetical protein ACUVTP_05660, partial [Candidatus Fervidibacter sp.]|uniref:hypothetical protein n=1 Tax=Candidatus Fervidibacter sp. TaxID=3100871 RepID=UPI00404AFE29
NQSVARARERLRWFPLEPYGFSHGEAQFTDGMSYNGIDLKNALLPKSVFVLRTNVDVRGSSSVPPLT